MSLNLNLYLLYSPIFPGIMYQIVDINILICYSWFQETFRSRYLYVEKSRTHVIL